MPKQALCTYVTGLPASGKTTVARYLANRLKFTLLDKDDFLEQLFDELISVDMVKRGQLSRQADPLFINAALQQEKVVLVSHWRSPLSETSSGTPVDWLAEHFNQVIEISCVCSVEVASQRFIQRKRHPGHNDDSRSLSDIRLWFKQYASMLPMGVGKNVQVNTESAHWQTQLLQQLKLRAFESLNLES